MSMLEKNLEVKVGKELYLSIHIGKASRLG